MHDILQVAEARANADAAQRLLEDATSLTAGGDDRTPLALMVGLGAVAICERLRALAVQLSHAQAVDNGRE